MNNNSPQSPSPSTDGGTVPSLTGADTPETEHSNMNSLPTPESRHSAMAMPLGTTILPTSPQRPVPSAIRRDRSPPRNANNEIICDHTDCSSKRPLETFRRLCEWNKHMDRHDRPYKCLEAGCELSPGFTYSGGLLRHQREVHKMHLSTKQPLYCPFPNCNRSSGAGFTRKENLEEHKRRRHLEEMSQEQSQSPPEPTNANIVPQTSPSRKRKRLLTPHPTEHEDDDGDGDFTIKIRADSADIEGHPTVKNLRLAIAQKDEIIRWQQMEMQKLQNLITSLPQQALYSINSGGMMGGGGGGGGRQGGNAYAKMT